MNVPKEPIEIAVGSGRESYEGMKAVKVDGKFARLIASDGSILAVVPISNCADAAAFEGLIGPEALQTARLLTDATLTIRGERVEVKANEGKLTFALPKGNYPDCEILLPSRTETACPPTISLDVNLLAKLCKALGNAKAQLWVRAPSQSVIVKPCNGPAGVFGLIMPLRPD